MSFHYRAYGLTVKADIALLGPRAAARRDFAEIDVEMREGSVPAALDRIETETVHWAANADELLLRVPRVGRFHVAHGNMVRYAPVGGAPTEEVQSFLLGSCLGAILHQRGQQVLHGSVVASGDLAFAICGKSGTGKSTSAAWLIERGARMMSDDLAAFSALEPPRVLPGYPQAKLTGAALAGLGRDTADLRKLPDDRDKFAIPREAQFLDSELPLGGIFVLERSDEPEPELTRLAGAQAMAALVKHTYRRHYVVASRAAPHYRGWGEIASRTPIWMIRRPREGDSTQFVVSAISSTISKITAEA